jgi:hypothetical protein
MDKTKSVKDKIGSTKHSVKTLKIVKEGHETQEKLDKSKEKLGKLDLKNDKMSPDKIGKTKRAEKKKIDAFPTNINEYRHIIDTFKVNDKDLEWVLELRSHKPVEYPGEKGTLAGHLPNFSSDIDYSYKRKDTLDTSYRGVSTDLEHLMRKRLGEQANQSQLEFESTLRTIKEADSNYKGPGWKFPKKIPRDNIEAFLPPVTKTARRNFDKNLNLLSRPYEIEINVKRTNY